MKEQTERKGKERKQERKKGGKKKRKRKIKKEKNRKTERRKKRKETERKEKRKEIVLSCPPCALSKVYKPPRVLGALRRFFLDVVITKYDM